MNTPRRTCAIAACLALSTLAACGSDSTKPTTPDLSGLYAAVTQADPATCEPASAVGVLYPVIGGPSLRATIKVEQLEGQVRMTTLTAETLEGWPVTFDPVTPLIAPLLADGGLQVETHLRTHFTLAERTYFEETTLANSGRFDWGADPMAFSLETVVTQAFREGSTDAPVFATCTTVETTTAVRTGA